jgi:hypothetical protein
MEWICCNLAEMLMFRAKVGSHTNAAPGNAKTGGGVSLCESCDSPAQESLNSAQQASAQAVSGMADFINTSAGGSRR